MEGYGRLSLGLDVYPLLLLPNDLPPAAGDINIHETCTACITDHQAVPPQAYHIDYIDMTWSNIAECFAPPDTCHM